MEQPATVQELRERLGIQRPELLEGLLDLGLSLGELAFSEGRYQFTGVISRMVQGADGDPLAAMIEEFVTVYTDVYRHARGAHAGSAIGRQPRRNRSPGGSRLSAFTEPFVRNFIALTVAGKAPLQLLEVGCGSGALMRIAHQANPQVRGVGIDMDAAVVEQARQNLATWGLQEQFTALQADIRQPPAEIGGPFELVTMHNNIYYFPPEERTALLSGLRGMLAPDGVLALTSSMQGKGKNVFAANFDLVTSPMQSCFRVPDEN